MEHFKDYEFACKCGCGLGLNDIDPFALRMLVEARKKAGVPFNINSAIRCKTHNTNVGGGDNSAHLRGHAFDIKIQNSRSAYKVLKALIEVGFNRIGHNPVKGFFHVDNDPTLPQDVFFKY